MDILVTGGAGFIGSHLCEKLLNNSGRIICVDNFNDFYDPNIKKHNISLFEDNNDFKLIRSDICEKEKISDIIRQYKPGLVVHLAAMAGVRPSIARPLLYEKVNIAGTLNLLEACRENGIKRFIFASSSSVYGGNKKIPFSEEDNVDHPISPYAATKKAGELLCHTYHTLFGISVFCFRFFTVYGPRQRPEMAIHKFTRKILKEEPIDIYGDGKSSRDYTFIDDIISGIAGSLDRVEGFQIFNLGNSESINITDLIRIIEKNTGKKAIIRHKEEQPGDVFTTFADITKAKKMLRYQPETGIEEGINNFVRWYQQMEKKGLFNG